MSDAVIVGTVYQDVTEWLACLDVTYTHLKATGWAFLSTLRGGIDQFGRTDHRKADLYELAGTQLGLSPRTLANYVSLSRSSVAQIAQSLDLEFSHAHAALGLDEDVARDLLSTAAEQNWEPAQVRREAWARKQGDASHNDVRSDDYPQPPEQLPSLRVFERGCIICRDAHDPMAHVELTVDGRLLTIEHQGSYIQFSLPKEYGIYRR